MKGKPSIDRVKEVLTYENGLKWKTLRPHCRKTERVGCLRPDGYVRVRIDRHHIFAHHLVWALHYGEWPTQDIDHEDRNRSNNVIENLRLANDSQNHANQKMSPLNTTGYKGVTRTPYGKFHAYLQKNGKVYHLGSHETPELAHAAYCDAAVKHHGEFARFE